ncbi:hypothetical protein IEQ34_005989 [Dendrobium chrysotoxum]|uniref:Uncharacterized protein n=1 Tax=Dendrobium chrysotoxum TaxID=161865 RepID=A0AAV7HA33_DENCH|nr:hypothetical protein IEQ34_005989 [Dendrobium chrysotoxum]
MSNKEDRTQAATALFAAKGMSRAQAECAAGAQARNVNAYGQKEKGPSRWQERKESKRQMYLMSIEKVVRLSAKVFCFFFRGCFRLVPEMLPIWSLVV